MIGRTIGSYQILAELGRGGMGEVYRARDTRLERDVAIKVLGGALAADADALARFEREAMSIAKLSHPNILAIFEFSREPSTGAGQADTAFVVTELVDGDTLRTRVEQGPLAPRKAAEIALHHHEKWDGSGYPNKLAGEAIPLSARIVQLADIYDALRSARPYKPAFTHERAVAIITTGDDRIVPERDFDSRLRAAFAKHHATFDRIWQDLHD